MAGLSFLRGDPAMSNETIQNLTAAVMPHDAMWCIEPIAGRRLWDQLKQHNMQQHVTIFAAQQAAKGEAEKPPKQFMMEGSTAVFTLAGPMTKSPTSWSSGTSTVRLRRQIDLARQDDDVTGAVMIIDSPGGSVAGTADLAAEIAKFRAAKTIVAYVEDCCCSAALWCASQCSAIYANSTALVGSQGTVMVIDDTSRQAQNEGIEPVVFATGKYKGAGTDGTQLRPEHRAYFQSIVDDLNSHFVAALRAGRPQITDEQMEQIASAAVYVGAAAQDLGLIDGIATLPDAMMAARGPLSRTNPPGKGKEKSTMPTLRERLSALLHGVRAGAQDITAEDAAILAAAERAVNGGADAGPTIVPPPAASALTADAIASAVQRGVEAGTSAYAAQVASLTAKLVATEATAQYDRDCVTVDSLVRQMRMTPAEAVGWKSLAKDNPVAFQAAFATQKDRPVIAQIRGQRLAAPRLSADDPGEKLSALAHEMHQKTGKALEDCFIAVSDQYSELTHEHKGNMNAAIAGGN